MMTMMLPTLTVFLIPFALMLMFKLISLKTKKDREKTSIFECGFDPISKARIPFSMRFFLLAVLFLVFDIEIAFLLPISILISTVSFSYFSLSSSMFVIMVTLGLFHEWNEGSLKWSK